MRWIHKNEFVIRFSHLNSLAIVDWVRLQSTLIIIYERASAYAMNNGDDKMWRPKRLRRPLLFISNWIFKMDLGAFIFFLFVCLLLSLWRPLPPCLTFGHIPFGTGSETLKFFVYVCCCFVALNNDSESKNHVGHTHAQTPFKWPWCSRSSALIQFYAKLVLLPFLPLKRVRRKWNYTNSYLRYWIEIAAMCIIRLLFRIKFDLIWNSLKIFSFCSISHFYEVY